MIDALAQKQPELGRHRHGAALLGFECEDLVVFRPRAAHDSEHHADKLTDLVQHEALPYHHAAHEFNTVNKEGLAAVKRDDVAHCGGLTGVHAHGVVVEVVGAAIVPKHFVHLGTHCSIEYERLVGGDGGCYSLSLTFCPRCTGSGVLRGKRGLGLDLAARLTRARVERLHRDHILVPPTIAHSLGIEAAGDAGVAKEFESGR
mmetsp:Transcript_18709/g.29958  ORF Transcript_18709/g.29958 Transcript_18709/m.29958 type:complete len:203 (+) Transcript_18709:1726-2334(+)